MFSQQKERAVKKALMLDQWISSRETKEIEEGFEVFSGAIKRVGDDFSWLAETLASLAKEVGWDARWINRITTLSQRLIYGATEKGLAISRIRIRGLGRTYVNRLLEQGYDTPEAIADLPLTELEKNLPKHLAERLYRHFHRQYEKKEETIEKEQPPAPPKIREAQPVIHVAPVKSRTEAPAPPPVQNDTFSRPLAEILRNDKLLSTLRTRLMGTINLQGLITHPPAMLIDERQMLLFYRGVQIVLPIMSYRMMFLLAKKPKVVFTRNEIYDHLWPERKGKEDLDRPYEQQITDHKWKILDGIKKGIKRHKDINPSEVKDLILIRPRVGYMLYLNQEDIVLI